MELSIGRLASLTDISVKTIRYYSDVGLLPVAGRSEGGYRRYDQEGLARLELVRTLRELGFDIETVRRILDHRQTLADVAAAHAAAIDLHIRRLSLRRALLRAIAREGLTPEETRRMSAFSNASAAEARRLMEEFVNSVFESDPGSPIAAGMRAGLPELPAEPTSEQLDAWVELSALIGDAGFRDRLKLMVQDGARLRTGTAEGINEDALRAAGRAVAERAGAALAAGVDPAGAEAGSVVAGLVPLFAAAAGRTDEPGYRRVLLEELSRFGDARVDRYWQLVAVIAGRPPQPSLMPAYEWFAAALAAHSR